jgi:hypothetical protein
VQLIYELGELRADNQSGRRGEHEDGHGGSPAWALVLITKLMEMKEGLWIGADGGFNRYSICTFTAQL